MIENQNKFTLSQTRKLFALIVLPIFIFAITFFNLYFVSLPRVNFKISIIISFCFSLLMLFFVLGWSYTSLEFRNNTLILTRFYGLRHTTINLDNLASISIVMLGAEGGVILMLKDKLNQKIGVDIFGKKAWKNQEQLTGLLKDIAVKNISIVSQPAKARLGI